MYRYFIFHPIVADRKTITSTRRLKSVHDQHVPRWRQNTAQSHRDTAQRHRYIAQRHQDIAQRHRNIAQRHQGRYSPALSVQFLPATDCNLLPLSPAAVSASDSEQRPLKKELEALIELVNSVRIDLLQTSMLVNYISDYIKTGSKVNTYARNI